MGDHVLMVTGIGRGSRRGARVFARSRALALAFEFFW